jgi:imidazolonepropionase-like amidohydrolase
MFKKNFLIFLLIIMFCISFISCISTGDKKSIKTIALVNGTLIDGTGAEPVPDSYIIIKDGIIMETGTSENMDLPSNTNIIDLKGKTILPGFINAHVFGAFNAENLIAWAQAGVTTVRDLWPLTGSNYTWDEWEQAVDEDGNLPTPQIFIDSDTLLNQTRYARLIFAGPILTGPGGYPKPWPRENLMTVFSPDDARRKTKTLINLGSDVISIQYWHHYAILSQEEIEAIVTAAHEQGKIVTGFAFFPSQIELLPEAGIDDIPVMPNNKLPDELIKEMVARDLYVVPCLSMLEAMLYLQYSIENLGNFVEAGGKVALGDSRGNPFLPLGMPIREMELMQEAGMTPMQIIVSATKYAAYVCNMEDSLGTLEPGKIADVIVIKGDPLEDIHALLNITWVIKEGNVIRSP